MEASAWPTAVHLLSRGIAFVSAVWIAQTTIG